MIKHPIINKLNFIDYGTIISENVKCGNTQYIYKNFQSEQINYLKRQFGLQIKETANNYTIVIKENNNLLTLVLIYLYENCFKSSLK